MKKVVHSRLDENLLKQIEEYRKTQSPIPTFNQALVDLLKYGLAQFFPEASIVDQKDEA